MRSFLGVRIPRDGSIAAEVSTRSIGCAGDRERKPVLRGEDPLGAPSSNDCVEPSRHLIPKEPTSTNWQLPNTARVEDVGGIIAAVGVVSGEAKPCQRRRSIELTLREAQNIFVITLADRTGVVHKGAETVLEPALVGDLKRLVVCSPGAAR